MKIREDWGPLGLTFGVLAVMLALAAVFGTGRGAAIYESAAHSFPIEPPSSPLSVPETAYDNALTAQEWTAWAAILTSGASLATLIVLLATLWTTRLMLSEARAATSAAMDTVRVTKEIGEAQVRCYLSITQLNITLHADHFCPLIEIRWYNSGNSPALEPQISIKAKAWIFEKDFDERPPKWRVADAIPVSPNSEGSYTENTEFEWLTISPDPYNPPSFYTLQIDAVLSARDIFGNPVTTHASSVLQLSDRDCATWLAQKSESLTSSMSKKEVSAMIAEHLAYAAAQEAKSPD